MATLRQKPRLVMARLQTRAWPFPATCAARFLILILLPLSCLAALESPDPLGGAFGNNFQHLASSNGPVDVTADSTRLEPSTSTSTPPEPSSRESGLDQLERAALGWQVAKSPPTSLKGLIYFIAILVVGGVAYLLLSPALDRYLDEHSEHSAISSAAVAESLAKLRAEDEAFLEFTATFHAQRSAPVKHTSAKPERNPLKEFLAKTPPLFGAMRKPLQDIASGADPDVRTQALSDLLVQVQALKDESGHPSLLPVWQMAFALEGLLKQLTSKFGNVTPSTLRTVAGAVDVLVKLCKPRMKPDILTNPPIRLLAVDDDPICRQAVSMPLKKALAPPDVAESGEAALALAGEHTYDVIFLDVLMPGTDGFETCTKIHETAPNRATPVVFVTTLSDFESCAKASSVGGADLIVKPFLSFEITVKALTFSLQGRLDARARRAPSPKPAAVGSKAASPGAAKNASAIEPPKANGASPEKLPDDNHESSLAIASAAAGASPPCELTPAFWKRAPGQLTALRDLIQAIFQTMEEHAQQQMLGAFSNRLEDFASEVSAAAGHPVLRLAAALQGLLKKLLKHPAAVTSSSLSTIAGAVDVLQELCAARARADLAENPPIRLLAVDDDVVVRQVISRVLRKTFEKTEAVESGEAALAVAKEQSFDVIFMDVQMPGMDGFTACMRIHETQPNHTTPVVFVTNHNDIKARSQSSVSGGCDFVAKPFLAPELTVKALTYALRGRLRQKRIPTSLVQQKQRIPKVFREHAVDK